MNLPREEGETEQWGVGGVAGKVGKSSQVFAGQVRFLKDCIWGLTNGESA